MLMGSESPDEESNNYATETGQSMKPCGKLHFDRFVTEVES
jgi:hypothetical protein